MTNEEQRRKEQECLERMVRVARDGIVIGVYYNDPELKRLEETWHRNLEEALKRHADDEIPFHCNSEMRSALIHCSAMGEAKEDLFRFVEYKVKLDREVTEDFFRFLKENSVAGYTSSPRDSKYPILLCIESARSGIQYVEHAMQRFPNYRFNMTEALQASPRENLIGHHKMIIV